MEGKPNSVSRFALRSLTKSSLLWVFALPILWGCGSGGSVPYETFLPSPVMDSGASSEKSNAYSDYLVASEEFKKNLGTHAILLNKASYSPAEQARIEAAAQGPLKHIKSGMGKSCHIPYAFPESPAANEGRSAWRLLSRVMIWRIQADCQAKSFGSAEQTMVLATKFGFDLASGLPNDASLGLLTVDQAREAIAPSLNDMTIEQLDELSKGMKTVFENRASMASCYDNAKSDSLEQVQVLQDAYKAEDYAGITKRFGSVAREIIPTLKELHQQSESKRAAFFNGFAQQAKDEGEQVKQDSTLPASMRAGKVAPPANVERPWKKIAKRVLGIGEPLLKMSDATNARTELLVVECQIVRALKSHGRTPADLSHFSAKIATDPYSGGPFIYRTDGSDYALYSVGEDLIDNDGETDATFSTPDLKLERASQ